MRIALSFIVVTLLSTAFANKPNDVVATVNGANITYKEFNENYRKNKLFVSDKIVTKEKVLNDIINRRLGITKAKQVKLQADPIVKEKMEDVLYHAQISKDLEPQLAKIVVTDNDVKSYYRDYPEYRTAHILMRLRANSDKAEEDAAMEQALKIHFTLKKRPEKFSDLADKYSQSGVASNGGDLGFLPAVQLAPEYFNAVKGQSVGAITAPVKTQFGLHIIKVLGVKKFEDVSIPLYKKIVYNRKRDRILADYFKSLRNNASIKIVKKYIE